MHHLAYCAVVRALHKRFLRSLQPQSGLELDTFLGLANGGWSEHSVVDWAHSIYALYRVYNDRRHDRLSFSCEEITEAFGEYLRVASRGGSDEL